jgi:threonine/homoserine/homoserine lactone efflux protein
VPPFATFGQALLVGLSIAAPVGPIGLLTIQRTLDRGLLVGLATGLGAAAADAIYGAIGAFGVRAAIEALSGARAVLALAGGLFLMALAVRTWRSAGAASAVPAASGSGVGRAFASSFALTLSNPATILSFVAIFAVLAGRAPTASAAWMVAGVFLGSALWWLLLCAGVVRLRRRLGSAALAAIRRGSAALLFGFGLWQWLGLVADV